MTVGATINVMMAAAMADGLTIMENVAKRATCCRCSELPEQHGSKYPWCRNRRDQDPWSEVLHKAEYSIIPDQIEAGTFMFAAAATRGDVTVLNVIPKHLDATISKAGRYRM